MASEKEHSPNKVILHEHKEFISAIGKKLKQLRTERKLSIFKLCSDKNISRNKYALMEKGKLYFNLYSLLQLLDYYKISPEEFFKDMK
ncbi:helix-turn-helix domain-containing protein [uncultured Draconibacterium sp.]|uniref:helix-turn-helix domain-containing protein n=1 Tax=uncultured Draconibacterium sp. TaxID=1573823 RepID=UPI00374A9235